MRHGIHAVVLIAATTHLAAPASAQPDLPTVFVGHYHPSEGSVAALTIDAEGATSFVGVYPSGEWTIAVRLSPSGRFLAASNATSNAVTEELRIFRVNPDSSLTLARLTTVPDSPLDMAWLTDDLLAVMQTGLSASSVGVYHWDAEALTLTFVSRLPAGVFAADMTHAPGLDYFFTEETLGGNAIRRFGFDAGGNLSFVGATPTPTYPLDLTLSNSAERIYAAGGISSDARSVLGYALDDKAGGALITALPGSPYTSNGDSPAYIAYSSDDRYLFVGHGRDATVRSFAIQKDGSLFPLPYVFDVGLQGTIGDIAVLDDFLLVTDDSTAIDGIAGLYVFRINDNGSFTQIGSIRSTGAPRAEGGIAVFSPPCVADWNRDGVVNAADAGAFLTDYFADLTNGTTRTDVDRNGIVNSADVGFYLTLFFQPCT